MSPRLRATVELPADRPSVWRWHARPGAFDRLAPPWQDLRVIERNRALEDGARLVMAVRKGPASLRWVALHSEVEPERRFVDVQESGPFAAWRHEHRFEDVAGDDGRSRLVDDVEYRLPLAPLSSAIAGASVRRDLERMFAYRQRVLVEDLQLHRRLRELGVTAPWRVAVTGSSGLVGRALCALLLTGGHEVVRIVRRSPRPRVDGTEVGWVDGSFVGAEALEGLDAFVDLAGENIAGGPWSARRRSAIRDSRGPRVRRVVEALGRLERPPRVYACASAVGIYGETEGEVVDGRGRSADDLAAVDGFLADVARGWERAAAEARAWAERVVHLRFGVILSPAGGALEKMVGPQRLGLGAIPGDGSQLVSWIALDDAVAAVLHSLAAGLDGPVDLVAPRPLPMADLVKTLGAVLRRPTLGRVPASLLRLGLGEMARETILASTGVAPLGLLDAGFVFRHDDLEDALRHLLGRAPLDRFGRIESGRLAADRPGSDPGASPGAAA